MCTTLHDASQDEFAIFNRLMGQNVLRKYIYEVPVHYESSVQLFNTDCLFHRVTLKMSSLY